MKKNSKIFRAVVTNIMNKEIKILSEGVFSSCLISGDFVSGKKKLCIGDHIEVEDIGNTQYRVLDILPRKTEVYRGNRRSPGTEILIAANVQFLLVIATADYLLNQAGYLESAIIAAGRAGIEAGIFISKWDLANEQTKNLLKAKIDLYRPVVNIITAGSGHEFQEDLTKAVKGNTVLVVGDRGCGKTTLINQSISSLKESETKHGKTASTHTGVLKAGRDETFWIDTPGFRNFALENISTEELNEVFYEIAEYADNCYFKDCTHVYEENCRVIGAIREKLIRRERYDAYQKMINIKVIPDRKPNRETKKDYRNSACTESFICKVCGTPVGPENAGTQHRNHCPKCLSSIHVDNEPGDRASLCRGIMDPISVWVRKGGEWAVIHRCRICGDLSSNRIAADDDHTQLLSIAVKPLAMTPFPLYKLNN
jgi:ribosome biogenesis GTPase